MLFNYIVKNLLLILILIIPSLGMVAGLSVSFTTLLFLLLLLLQVKFIKIDFSKNKEELISLLWSIISCLWTKKFIISIFACLKVFSLLFFAIFLLQNQVLNKIKILPKKIVTYINYGFFLSLALFFIEYFSQGMLFKVYSKILKPYSYQEFFLFKLDRGCALLSLVSWVVINNYLQNNRCFLAFSFYLLTFITLAISDSLASFLSFIIGGVIFTTLKFAVLKISKVIKMLNISIIFIMVILPILIGTFTKIDNSIISILPLSAIHRIFIWKFVILKILEKPITGWGFDISRVFDIQRSEIIEYNSHTFHLLPLHPHNNILQLWFETGAVGVIILILLIYKYSSKILNIIDNGLILGKTHQVNYGISSYACFVNYLIIGMISYNVWQTWWISSIIWVILIFNLSINKQED